MKNWFRNVELTYIIRSNTTAKYLLEVYTKAMVKVAVIRTYGLGLNYIVKQLPSKTEYFFGKFLIGDIK